MIAKLIINEIKQNIEGSSLGTIGIGEANVLKLYHKLNKRWPHRFNEQAEKLDSIFERFSESSSSDKIKNRMNYYKEVFEEYSDSSLSDFICVNIYSASETTFTETDELLFDMGFDFDDAYAMFDEEMDNGHKVTFSSKLEYLRRVGIGIIYLNNSEKPYDRIIHCVFVKYK